MSTPAVQSHRTRPGGVAATISYAFAAVLLFISSPYPASADEYLPLWIGNRWDYRGVGGASETQLISRMLSIWGTQTFVIDYESSTSNEGLGNYWTTESDGDVLLWGFFRKVENFGVLYRPALRVLDAPLYVGKTWSGSFAIYSLPDTLYEGTYEIAWEVYEAETLTVPAGTFFTYGIGQTIPPAALRGHSITGVALGVNPRGNAVEWYTQGIGKVQYQADDLYQLAFYVQPTPVPAGTWGRIKTLFM